MAKKLRVGLLGAGYIADFHASALKRIENVELVAICDSNRLRAENFAKAHHIPQVYEPLNEMLQDKLDVIHVLLPPDLHYSATQEILNAGTHVFLEKPMCLSFEESERLISLAEKNNLRLAVNHNFLFYPIFEKLKRDIENQEIGEIDLLTITWQKELDQLKNGPFGIWMLRQPRNMMLEVGSHLVASLLYLVGKPENVKAVASAPLTLPNGNLVYRKWYLSGQSRKTSVELRLSVKQGFEDVSIQVHGSIASAKVDFDKNTYIKNQHGNYSLDFDRYFMTRKEGKCLQKQAFGTFKDAILSKIGCSKKATPYLNSMIISIKRFYATLGGVADPRHDAKFGANVIKFCNEISDQALPKSQEKANFENKTIESTFEAKPDILVLGGAGFIGQALIRELLDQGHSIRILVKDTSKIPLSLLNPRLQIIKGDITDSKDLEQAIKGMAYVYHLAKPAARTWEDYCRFDVEVARNIAQVCLKNEIKGLFYTSSIAVYNASSKDVVINESTPFDVDVLRCNLYARAKVEIEKLLLEFHKNQQLPVSIFRPGVVLGVGGNPFHLGIARWYYNSVCEFYGKGNNLLPTILVEDVAIALVKALEADDIAGTSFNLVADPCLSAQDYVKELETVLNARFAKYSESALKRYLNELSKWAIKKILRYPETHFPSYKDCKSRELLSPFDCSRAKKKFQWNPISERSEIVRQGIHLPAQKWFE